MSTRDVWFCGYRCDCTYLATDRADMPTVCPDHGATLLGPGELCRDVAAWIPLGLEVPAVTLERNGGRDCHSADWAEWIASYTARHF